MPTYEYECPKCPRTFEVRQRISEAPLTVCDRCGGPVRRLLSPAPFILKGGGWYVTDYPSESRKQAMKSESSGSSATDGKSSTGGSSSSSSSDSSGASSSSGSSKTSGGSDSASGSKTGTTKSDST